MLTKIKTITSHAGLARFLDECDGGCNTETPAVSGAGYLPRNVTKHIPSPYRSGPTVALERWNNRIVCWFETRHKRYEVYAVTDETIYSNPLDAENVYISSLKK